MYHSLKIGLMISVSLFGACSVQNAPTQNDSTPDSTAMESYAPSPLLSKTSYAPSPLLSKTLPELAEALKAGNITSEALTQAYLTRIERVDKSGPTLQAVLTLNPEALNIARALDVKRANGETLGALHGLPILLKDNIESADPMPTTAGAMALLENMTERDAPLVAELRKAGAVILGKANLSQWANFRSEESLSGWSALGGQVRNPHSLDRNPCGSSSGSGAGVAASLAAGAVGTETNGSIICPSTVNGVVGFKPTVGLVSQKYIIPISSSQDTAGPMTKSVRGAAMMLGAMDTQNIDYTSRLSPDALRGKRLGVLRFAQGSHAGIKNQFNDALKTLEAAGAELIEIDSFDNSAENYGRDSYAVLQYEFKATLNEYLNETPQNVKTRTLSDLITFNKNTPRETALFDQSIFKLSDVRGPLSDPAYISAKASVQKAVREDGIDLLLRQYEVAALVAPSGPLPGRIDPVNGDTWPAWAGAGYMAAVAGYPHISVPMGTVRGLPVGLSFMGAENDDANILSFGYAFEQMGSKRIDPTYRKNAEDWPDIARAMRSPANSE